MFLLLFQWSAFGTICPRRVHCCFVYSTLSTNGHSSIIQDTRELPPFHPPGIYMMTYISTYIFQPQFINIQAGIFSTILYYVRMSICRYSRSQSHLHKRVNVRVPFTVHGLNRLPEPVAAPDCSCAYFRD